MSLEKRMKMGLFRFGVIAPLVCRRLSPEEKQGLRRQVAGQVYDWPDGKQKRVGGRTLGRWLSEYRGNGFDGLLDLERGNAGICRGIEPEVLLKAEQLRRELPSRSVRSIISILKNGGLDTSKLAASTLSRQLKRKGATKERLTQEQGSYQRWEQERVNDMWQADTAHGIWLPDPSNPRKTKKCKLIAFIDDASRVMTHAQFYWDEQLPSLIDCFRKALLKRGKPRRLLLDNAFIFHSTTLKEMSAQLGIEISFCEPYSPSSKGKIERGIGSIKSRFYGEAIHSGITGLSELNEFFFGWLTKEYHHKVHTSLNGQTPIERWRRDESLLLRVTPEDIRRALMLKARRQVHLRTSTISLESRIYQVSTSLAGEFVEVRWQANKTEEIEVWLNGKCVDLGRLVIVGANIDFSRKPAKAENCRQKTLFSSKQYRKGLSAGFIPVQASGKNDLLSVDEFINLTARLLTRQLTDEEKEILSRFFFAVAPISEAMVIDSLNLAVRAKGGNLHLRFYCHHLEQTLRQTRS